MKNAKEDLEELLKKFHRMDERRDKYFDIIKKMEGKDKIYKVRCAVFDDINEAKNFSEEGDIIIEYQEVKRYKLLKPEVRLEEIK